jgi:hypothetical protein
MVCAPVETFAATLLVDTLSPVEEPRSLDRTRAHFSPRSDVGIRFATDCPARAAEDSAATVFRTWLDSHLTGQCVGPKRTESRVPHPSVELRAGGEDVLLEA